MLGNNSLFFVWLHFPALLEALKHQETYMKFSFPHVAFVGAFEWGSASGFAQDFPLKSICIIVGALPGRVVTHNRQER
jgi:hypothetical protein